MPLPSISPSVAAKIAPSLHVPAPPRFGSATETRELAYMHTVQAKRTPQRNAWAVNLDKHGGFDIWMGKAHDYRAKTGLVDGWIGTGLVTAAVATGVGVDEYEKLRFDRQRPFKVDPTLHPLGPIPHDSSYPSGHSAASFAAATVLSALEPADSRSLHGLATQVKHARVYSAVHFPSDVNEGQLVGTAVGDRVLDAARALKFLPKPLPADAEAVSDANQPPPPNLAPNVVAADVVRVMAGESAAHVLANPSTASQIARLIGTDPYSLPQNMDANTNAA